ncbi:MAG: transposase [Salinibacter sp.]
MQICRLYHHRWSIEIVFRGLSGRLRLGHFIRRDPRGVTRQIVMALIVWGLLASTIGATPSSVLKR